MENYLCSNHGKCAMHCGINNYVRKSTVYLRFLLFGLLSLFLILLIVLNTNTVCSAEDLLQSADSAFQAKRYSKAGEIYHEVFINSKKGPLAERALFGMARSDFKLKRYSEASFNLQRFLMAYPQSTYVNEVFFLSGYILLHEHKLDEAARCFEKVGGILKSKADIGRAEVAIRLGDIAGAESVIGTAESEELERNPRAVYVRAAILSRKGLHKGAVAILAKVPDAVLKEEDLRVDKALIFLDASQLEDAEKICKSIIADPVSRTEKLKAERILAGIYERKGSVDKALPLYTDIVLYEPDDSVIMSLTKLYEIKGDTRNALRYASLLKDQGLKSAEIEKQLKQVISAANADAVQYVLRFSASINKDSPFLITAARFLIKEGKKREGLLMLKRAEAGVEKGAAALYLAQVLFNEGKYSEAKKNIAPLLLENRYFIKASLLMAEIMTREGDLQGAIACMEKAYKYSKDIRITDELADLYFESGDRATAFKFFKKASDNGDANSSLMAADLLFLSGKSLQSLKYYHRALSLGLSDKKSRQWAYYQYGKITGNNEYLKKAVNSGGLVGEAAGILAGKNQ